MPKQQNSNDSGCVCMCSAASSTHQSARLPVSILRNICICCVTGTVCSALDRLLHLLTDSLESFGSCRDLVPEPHAMPNQASCSLSVPGYFFPCLVNYACASWWVQIAIPSHQLEFVEIAVYLCCQFSHDTVFYFPPEPDKTWAKFPAGKNQHEYGEVICTTWWSLL